MAATAGSAVFSLVGAPAAWLTGSMFVTACIVLRGISVPVPRQLREFAFLLIGTFMGSSVSPDLLARIATWPVTLGLLALSVPVVMVLTMLYLRRIEGWEMRTAFFSSAPGALSAILVLSEAYGGDTRRVMFAQSMRLLVMIACMPWLLSVGGGLAPPIAPAAAQGEGAVTTALFVAAACLGGLVLERLRFPGGLMVGALAVSAALHGTGSVETGLPELFQFMALIAMGIVIGARFAGTTWAMFKDYFRAAAVATGIATLVSTLFAEIATIATGEPFLKIWLAYMPGALEVMTLMSYLLGVDPVFVSVHHLLRFLGIIFAMPLISYWLLRQPGGGQQQTRDDGPTID